MIGYTELGAILIGLGCWNLSDGIYSWTLYHNAASYQNGRQQTFWKDHWVRCLRIIVSLGIMYIGWILL